MVDFAFRGEYHDEWLTNAGKQGFPALQLALRSKPAATVNIDFSECDWLSAACALSLFTEVANSSTSGRKICFDFGSTTTVESRACVRKFLISQGFVECIVNASFRPECSFRYDRTEASISAEQIRILSRFESLSRNRTEIPSLTLEQVADYVCDSSVPLLFGDLAIIRAHLFELAGTATSLSKTQRVSLDELMREADSVLYRFNARDRSYRDTTLQRVNQTLLELLANCAEHSADPTKKANQKSYAGVFVRLTPTKQSSDRASRTLAVAARMSFALQEVMRGNDQARIELYVVDTGVGLLAHAPGWYGSTPTAPPIRDLRTIAKQLFVNAFSRHKRNSASVATNRGLKTGFQHLHTIWSHSNDWSRILTGREWLAGPHPRPPGWDINSEFTGGHREFEGVFRGTLVHVVITPSLPPSLTGHWFDSTNRSSGVTLKAVVDWLAAGELRLASAGDLTRSNRTSSTRSSRVRDASHRATHVLNVRRGEALKSVEKAISQLSRKGISKLFVRLHRVTEKNIVTRIVEAWQKSLLSDPQLTHAALYICDLGRYQALDTGWVLEHSTKVRLSAAVLVPPRASVFVVTEDLCLGAFNVSWVRAGNNDKIEFEGVPVQVPLPSQPELEGHLFGLVSELREDDSMCFWDRLKEIDQQPDSFSLIRNVQWQAKPLKVLPLYVNLSQVIHDREISRSIRRALRRLLALFPHMLHAPIDGVVEAPMHDAKKWLTSSGETVDGAVLVGSTSVTGSTLLSRTARVAKLAAIVDILESPYFKYKPLGTAPHLCAIRWRGNVPKKAALSCQYERIPGTPYIRPLGNALPIVAPSRPVNYKYVVSNDLLRLGHWSYGDRHSLLEIDTGSLIEFSARTETDLVNWLADQIWQISRQSHVVLVFPMHRWAYTLAHVVHDRILKLSADVGSSSGAGNPVSCTLVPLVMMHRVAGGMTRIAPLSKLQLLRAKDNHNSRNELPTVVILDTAYITNRTRRHIARQILSLGFSDVRSTGAINRSSLPALQIEVTQLAINPNSFDTYLRWNVPILGSSHHCLLCKSILALRRMHPIMKRSQPDLISELSALLDVWSSKDAADHFATSGVRPRLLTQAAQDVFARTTPPSIELIPWPYSTAVASRFVESLREGVSVTELAPTLHALSEVDPFTAIEVACSCLLLSGYGDSQSEHGVLVRHLVESLVYATQKGVDNDIQDRESQQSILYLATLVIVALEPIEKRTHLPRLVAAFTGCKLSNTFRLLMFVYLSDTTGDYAIARELCDLIEEIEVETEKSLADSNFARVVPYAKGYARSMTALLELFGETANHAGQAAINRLEIALHGYVSVNNEKSRSTLIDELSATLSRFAEIDVDFLINCIGISKDDLDFMLEPVSEYMNERGLPDAKRIRLRVDHLNDRIGKRLYGQLVKYGSHAQVDNAKLSTPFVELIGQLNKQGKGEGVSPHGIDLDQSAYVSDWPADARGYLPFINEAIEVFARILSNAREYGVASSRELFGERVTRDAWVTVVPDGSRGVRIEVENAINRQDAARLGTFDLSNFRFVVGLGFEATSSVEMRDGSATYITRIRIPSTATIKEQL